MGGHFLFTFQRHGLGFGRSPVERQLRTPNAPPGRALGAGEWCGVDQWSDRRAHNSKAEGSNPSPASTPKKGNPWDRREHSRIRSGRGVTHRPASVAWFTFCTVRKKSNLRAKVRTFTAFRPLGRLSMKAGFTQRRGGDGGVQVEFAAAWKADTPRTGQLTSVTCSGLVSQSDDLSRICARPAIKKGPE